MTRLSFQSLRAQRAAAAVALALCVVSLGPATAGTCIGCFGVVTVGRSGLGANCTTASIQDAINKAKLPEWADEVWITNDVVGGEYRVGTLNISDQTVEIIGGFADCLAPAPTGFTTISGAGGDTNSVFTIRGSSNVGMTGLIVTGGDDGINDDGGGIDFKGNGNLTLQKMRVVGNFAGYGGGILAGAGAFSLNVTLLDDVLIADNVAIHNGGGIHALGARVNVTGVNVGIHRNTAQGINGGGFGGGLYIKIPARAEISATGYPDGFGGEYPVFADNTAVKGGAIAAMGADDNNGSAFVRLSPGISGGPLVFARNKASSEGGALYSGAVSVGAVINTSSSGLFCAYDTAFRDNVAPDGAAIYYDSASAIGGDEQGHLSLNGGPGCGGPTVRRCAAGSVCNEFSGNRTQTLGSNLRTDGAIVEFEGNIGRFESRGSLFKNNIGGTLVHMGDGADGSLLSLLNCVLLNNNLTRPTVDSDADKTLIRHCTIADNVLLGQHVLRIVESGATGADHLASITNSIIAQPGEISLDLGGAAAQTVITHVLASEIFSLKPDSAFGTVFNGNPQFANPAGGDYRPGALSEAVDYAPTLLPDGNDDGFLVDALRFPRSVDLPARINITGFRDLGAFEVQPGTPIPEDELFLDGFEN